MAEKSLPKHLRPGSSRLTVWIVDRLPMIRLSRLICGLLALGPLVGLAESGEAAKPPAVDYLRDVRPIFLRRCSRCHGARKQEAGLRLDAGRLILKGGDDGAVVSAGRSSTSKLLERVRARDESRMPPEGEPLAVDEIATLDRWIQSGARYPADETIPEDPAHHWAFVTPRASAVPRVQSAELRNPIDAFIAARLHDKNCIPVHPASRSVLLRRVTIDLTGLPPTVDELHAFLGDGSPDAYERVVDRLLASPAYAERWARHWMDVWRYSDWYGFGNELRNSARHIWRWRDWIVESLQTDKPYSEMLVAMLAADEADPTNESALRATGFLARNYYLYNRNVWLDATVEHTAKAFLGITLNCARCHDHMYDPIEQADYYRFRAIFEPHRVRVDQVGTQIDTTLDGVSRVYDADLKTQTFLYLRGNDKTPDKDHPLGPAVPAALHGPKFDICPVSLPLAAYHPSLSESGRRRAIQAAEAACAAAGLRARRSERALQGLLKARSRQAVGLKSTSTDEIEEARSQRDVDQLRLKATRSSLTAVKARIQAELAVANSPWNPKTGTLKHLASHAEREAAVAVAEADVADATLQLRRSQQKVKVTTRRRGKRTQSPEAVLASAKARLATAKSQIARSDDRFTPLGPTYPQTSTGRRLALARWLASNENPLTARVAINHVWLRHFRSPLVPTVFDFGLNGKPPTHPELLDWLAVDFMRSGWRLKRLHRLIVLSEAYRRDSAPSADCRNNLAADPENRLLWRMNEHRLESEAVRDSILAVSGRLDCRIGGPDLDATLGETTYRRSLYYRHAPEKFMTFLQTFDAPSTNECYARIETIVPQQALALANSVLCVDQSRQLAHRLTQKFGSSSTADASFAESLFESVLGRPCSEAEKKDCLLFLRKQTSLLRERKNLHPFTAGLGTTVKGSEDPHQRARESLAHVLFNHNDFVTVR